MKYLLLLTAFFLSATANAQSYAWKKLSTEPYPGKQDDIFFINPAQGWYVNGYGRIYHTTDSGNTWEKQLEQKGTFFRCIAFIDSLRGFAGTVGTDYFPNVTDTIPLYRTVDGGKSWLPVAYKGPYVKGLCALEIVKEQFVNSGNIDYRYHVYGVGRVGSPSNLMVSHDGGESFESTPMDKHTSMLFDVKMFNKREGVACGASSPNMEEAHGRMIYTEDGGKTWKTSYESTRPFEITWKCFFPSRKIGYATLQSYNPDTTATLQRLLKTTDGGKSWQEMKLCEDYKARAFGVGFVDEKTGFIGTMAGGYKTTDGGATWTKQPMGRAINKIRILHLPDGKVCGYGIGVELVRLVVE